MLFLALATLVLTPSIAFTSDSVYKNENILVYDVREFYEGDTLVSKDLVLSRATNVMGYTIYDDPATAYIDGLKIDDKWVTDWVVKDYDDTVEHTIYVKTVYTDDIAGMLAAAQDGDFSKLLSNPVMIFQLIYYILATIGVVSASIMALFGRKKKQKTSQELANECATAASNVVNTFVTDTLIPVFTNIVNSCETNTEAIMYGTSNDPQSKLALVELVKNKTSSALAQKIITDVQASQQKKLEAREVINNIAKDLTNEALDKVKDEVDKGLI